MPPQQLQVRQVPLEYGLYSSIQQDQGGPYRVLPTAEVGYSWEDAFIPVTRATLDAMKGDAAQQLLT